MSESVRSTQPGEDGLSVLSQGLLSGARGMSHARHTLEIRHQAAPSFAPALLQNASDRFGVSLSFNQGRAPEPGHRIHCCTADLPFQDRVFSVILLHHVLRDGSEAELSEAVRVLARDGVLFVLGLNRLGVRYRLQKGIHSLPGLAPLKVKFELDRLNMETQGFSGAGILGMNRPKLMNSGLTGLGLPLADVVLLRARRADSPEVSLLRFSDRRSGIVQSAPLSG